MTIIIITILTMTISIFAIYLSLFDSAEWLREKIGRYVDRDLLGLFAPFLYFPFVNFLGLVLIVLLRLITIAHENNEW